MLWRNAVKNFICNPVELVENLVDRLDTLMTFPTSIDWDTPKYSLCKRWLMVLTLYGKKIRSSCLVGLQLLPVLQLLLQSTRLWTLKLMDLSQISSLNILLLQNMLLKKFGNNSRESKHKHQVSLWSRLLHVLWNLTTNIVVFMLGTGTHIRTLLQSLIL